jgi:hypothetical protein
MIRARDTVLQASVGRKQKYAASVLPTAHDGPPAGPPGSLRLFMVRAMREPPRLDLAHFPESKRNDTPNRVP